MQTTRVADIQAATSAFLAGGTWLVDGTGMLQIAATVVAIVAGLAAAWSHIERAVALRRQRKEKDKNG